MLAVAKTVYGQPPQYEKLMLQAAQLDPTCYYALGDYVVNQHQDDKAAEYYDKGCDADPDADRATDYAPWRVRYYLSKGQTEKAGQIAYFSGEVYSYYGLEAEGIFFELTSNYDEAYQWYYKIGKRYEDYSDLATFCGRYKALTGNPRFDVLTQKYQQVLFPKGLEKASLANFKGPPSDGVLIRQENDLVVSAGLKKGDVIVAIGGTRVHNFSQYAYLRDTQINPELDLIVWQHTAYNELWALVPNHRFGVDFGDYQPR